MKITNEYFGKTGIEKGIQLYTLTNSNGMIVRVTNYGATITSIVTPDKLGNFDDVVLGFDNIDDYITSNSPYMGVVCGRYANRIAKGKFSINGTDYTLAINNGPNALHGGIKGFDKVIWNAEIISHCDEAAVKLSYVSPDGEEGYPGNMQVTVTYILNNQNELLIKYTASTDKTTVVNLTNHSYFNLNGAKENVLKHLMLINANSITEVNDNSIPLGNYYDVTGTGFDLRAAKAIGTDIDKVGGYDHNYILNKPKADELTFAAKVTDPESGRVMEVQTTEPGVQFYSANYLDGSIKGKDGIVYQKHYGFCLETQHFPDSPNQAKFPSTLLKPGETYYQLTIYKFGVE
jgi:aldose 1-epimerase